MSKLTVYNEALRMIGERPLASLSEDREPLRILNSAWDGGALDYCLEQGLWNFAQRTVKLTPETSATSGFGYTYVYAKPSDFIRINRLAADENLRSPVIDYVEEGGIWLCNHSEIYLQYVSNDAAFGADDSLWPKTFQKFVAAYLATEICESLTQSSSKHDKAYKLMRIYRADARSKDAQEQAPQFLPRGSWQAARGGGRRFGGNDNGGIY